ncbi:hypothetical protein [Pedobacter flavus]|uniref:Uncharacterized protein n=1 Tax=Pedobacter flavus TaxID=3113906 RepID=A0ABU7GZ62_9SPHI|nr:hypothetical protein [Pedobacter sp. VNH31]MEE1884375.1 hypothetical protein [Pedobacter sp. VNH31]
MNAKELLTLLIPLLITFLYKTLEHLGVIDILTGRKHLLKAYEYLSKPYGYPTNWFYAKKDKVRFSSIYKILKRYCKQKKFKDLLSDNTHPEIISVGGEPIAMRGVPASLPQHIRAYYPLSSTVILLVYNPNPSIPIGENHNGKGLEVCTLEELKNWIDKDKKKLDYWISTVGVFLFLILLARLALIYFFSS